MYFLQAQPGFGGFQFIFLGLMIVVFWLFFIRPQAKKAKQQKSFIDNLQKGDKVVTIAGIHGVVNRMNDDGTIQLEIKLTGILNTYSMNPGEDTKGWVQKFIPVSTHIIINISSVSASTPTLSFTQPCGR